jgi:peptide/nickel transport system substrate-binding protein
VDVVSDTVIEFALPEAFAPFLDYLSFQVLPVHLLGNLSVDQLVDHPFNLAPVGSGPYKFSKFLVEDGVVTGVDLVANADFYCVRPYID